MSPKLKFYKDVLINPDHIPFSAGVIVVGVYSDEEDGFEDVELNQKIYFTNTEIAHMHKELSIPVKAAEQIIERLTEWKDKYTSIYEELTSEEMVTLEYATSLIEWKDLYEEILHTGPKQLYDILIFGEGSYWYQSKLPVEYTKTLIGLLDKMIAEYLEIIRKLSVLDVFL
jgi:hypothetical protein